MIMSEDIPLFSCKIFTICKIFYYVACLCIKLCMLFVFKCVRDYESEEYNNYDNAMICIIRLK